MENIAKEQLSTNTLIYFKLKKKLKTYFLTADSRN